MATELEAHAQEERDNGKILYPPQEQIFRALQLTKPEDVRVCLVGQDPYHTPGQANGLAFSIAPGNPLQPSLVNIFKELEEDVGIKRPESGDLTKWAENGVLLLNTSLTVYEHQANSCVRWGWDRFTKSVLQTATKLPQPVVFLLWGSNAQDLLKAYVLSSHPSPFSATRPCRGTPAFRGSKPFSTANKLLTDMGGTPIDWSL